MELPEQSGIMTLRNATLFPQSMLPLYIFEPRYRKMLRDALESNRMFCIAMRKPHSVREIPEPIAGLGLIRAAVDHEDGTTHLVLEGITRVLLGDTVRYRPYRINRITPVSTPEADNVHIDALTQRIRELVAERLELGLAAPQGEAALESGESAETGQERVEKLKEILRYINKMEDPAQLADMVAGSLLSGAEERQTILATTELERRLKHLARFLTDEIRRIRKFNA